MPNISSLIPNATRAITLSNLVLVTPQTPSSMQPQNRVKKSGQPSTAAEPPKLLFQYEGDQSIDLVSDITDHYVEDNSAVEDQIALKPEEYTVQGYIGELNDIVPALYGDYTPKFVADKLSVLGAYVPGLSTSAQEGYRKAAQAYQVAERATETAVSAWTTVNNFFGNSDSNNELGGRGSAVFKSNGVQNKQQTMFQQLYGYWRQRTLFSVQTPWALFRNMAIKNLRAIQNADTRMITDFTVTFKMIRRASTVVSGANVLLNSLPTIKQGRLESQSASLTNTGTSSGTPGPTLSEGLASMGVA